MTDLDSLTSEAALFDEAAASNSVTTGLGWPRNVVADSRIGWPAVSRETLTWTVDNVAPIVHFDPRGAGEEVRVAPPKKGAPPLSQGPNPPPAELSDKSDSMGVGDGDSSLRASQGVAPPSVEDLVRPPVAEIVSAPIDGVGSAPEKEIGPPPVKLVTASAEEVESDSTAAAVRGPRRARFDEDEFGPAPQEEPEPVSRETSGKSERDPEMPPPRHTRVLVVANQKGGVGKTTTSVNLAAALALGGLSVLVIDLDPQGNASTALGVDHGPGVPGTYEVLIAGDPISEHAVDSPEAPTLRVLPASIDLAGAEIELVSMVARENRLLRGLKTYLKENKVDYVFLDCPPSLGLLTLNALVAAQEILIPIQCEYYALEGVSQLLRTIDLVKGELNDELKLSTVLLTMFDARTRLAAQVADEVRTHFAEQTLPSVIPRSVRISEAPSYGQTVLTYHPDSAGAVSYLAAAREIARRGAEES